MKRVAIVKEGGRYAVRVDGRPYVIRGAGMSPVDSACTTHLLDVLVTAGGNTIRTWETQGIDDLLDQAHRHGIAVLVGLGMEQQLAGFDYDDAVAVTAQRRRIVSDVERLYAHPAVFGWLVGNELNLVPDGEHVNLAVWHATSELVSRIKRTDPNHPVGATFALTASLGNDIDDALSRAEALDFIGLQAYGELAAIPDVMSGLDTVLPYLITEYGPVGHWEMPATDWGREIEEPSGIKADGTIARLDGVVSGDVDNLLLGSFAFLWGDKQERTPTWYGLFTVDGRRTAMVDELQRRWTGNYPEQRAPRATGITLNELSAGASVRVTPGQRLRACVTLDQANDAGFDVIWELRREISVRSVGGHSEQPAERIPLLRIGDSDAGILCLDFLAPEQPGEYRVFSQINNEHDGAATANQPFLVIAGPG